MHGRAQEQCKESDIHAGDGVLAFSSHCVCGIWVYSLKLQSRGFAAPHQNKCEYRLQTMT